MSGIEDAIRRRAYELWEHADGRSEVGQGVDDEGIENLLMPHSWGKVER